MNRVPPPEFGDIERAQFESQQRNRNRNRNKPHTPPPPMTTDHPQHSTNRRVVTMTRDDFVRACVRGLQSLAAKNTGVTRPPNHRAVLSSAAAQSKPFRVRPAPMPDDAA